MNEMLVLIAAQDWAALARLGGLAWAAVFGTLAVLWIWSELLLALGGSLRGGARTTVFALLFVLTAALLPLAALPAWHWLAGNWMRILP